MSGEKASFLAGGEFPIPVQGDRDQITVDYKKFGVGLTFTPTVLANGVINLRIEPEVSQLDYTNTVRTATVAVPALIVRRASTVVELRDGQSFAVAGSSRASTRKRRSSCPGWRTCRSSAPVPRRPHSSARRPISRSSSPPPRKPAATGQRLKTPLDATAQANDADLFLVGQQEVPVAKARVSGTAPFGSPADILNRARSIAMQHTRLLRLASWAAMRRTPPGLHSTFERKDTLGYAAGDAIAWNKSVHTIDPWPAASADTTIPVSGRRVAAAIERYENGGAPPAGRSGRSRPDGPGPAGPMP